MKALAGRRRSLVVRRSLVSIVAAGLGLAGPLPAARAASGPDGAGPAVGAVAHVPGDEHPLERARRAARDASFSGVVVVRWRDGDAIHRHRLDVRAAGGAVMVEGSDGSAMAGPDRARLVKSDGGDWSVLWSAALGQAPAAPDARSKYRTEVLADHAEVIGRPTTVVEIRHRDALRARLYLDEQTGLLLRRDHYGDAGEPERTMEFESLAVDSSAAPLAVPRPAADHAPRLGRASRAPEVLGDGYVRLGAYRRGPVVHVHYSDGLYTLSLFEQRGRLERGALPGPGRRVRLRSADARLYSWPGGHVLVWQAGHVVRTLVSDAPATHLTEAARSVPPSGSPSLLQKLRRACGALVDPLQ